jgi:hypothetical protein
MSARLRFVSVETLSKQAAAISRKNSLGGARNLVSKQSKAAGWAWLVLGGSKRGPLRPSGALRRLQTKH